MIIFDTVSYNSIFTIGLYDTKNKKLDIYKVSDKINQSIDISKYIKSKKNNIWIGFNSTNIKMPVLKYILNMEHTTPNGISNYIDKIDNGEIDWSDISKSSMIVKRHIDLHKMHHFDKDGGAVGIYDVKAKLKICNMEYLEPDFRAGITNEAVLCIESNLKSNIRAINDLLNSSNNEIKIRTELSKSFKKNLLNYNDTRIGEFIFLRYISHYSKGITRKELVSNAPGSKYINLKDCIFNNIKFIDKSLIAIKDWISKRTVNLEDGKFLESIPIAEIHEIKKYISNKEIKDKLKNLILLYSGIAIKFGLGGLHGCNGGLYDSDENNVIIDDDVTSYYPKILINNKLHPSHIDGKLFNNVASGLYDSRNKLNENDPKYNVLKQCLVSVVGKTKQLNSPFYDSEVFLKITINGQLMLLKYIEMLSSIPDIKFIQINTDGIVYRVNRVYVEDVNKIRNNWIKMFDLDLKSNLVDKIAIKDVNDYIAKYNNGSVKCKGIFEINKNYKKSQSQLIIPIALKEYFINNTPIKETILSHKEIVDFCIYKKSKKGIGYTYNTIKGSDLVVKNLPKYIRFIASNRGGSIIINSSTTNEKTKLFDKTVVMADDLAKISEDNINYKYYIEECGKIVFSIIKPKELFI